MHYSGVGSNGSPEGVVGVSEVDDNDLVLLVDLFANAYVMVGFEC
jgi:hypothetical protein